MNEQIPLSEKIVWLIKNNRILAIVIVLGSIIIAIGTATDATKKIVDLFKNKSPEDARAKLAQMDLPYEPEVFLECVEKDDLTAVNLFLSAGMNPDTAWPDDSTALMLAAKYGQKPLLTALLKGGADINKQKRQGKSYVTTALSEAAYAGKLDNVKLLLDRGADRESRNVALSNAADRGHIEILYILIDSGVDDKAINKAFVEAARWARKNILSILHAHGADVKEYGSLALLAAANNIGCGVKDIDETERAETIQYLVDLGVDVDAVDEDGCTALCSALYCRHNHAAIVLLDGGANPNLICKPVELSPLTLATKSRHRVDLIFEVVEKLLEKGADPNFKNPDGSTALITAISNQGFTDVIRELLEAGADHTEKSASWGTAAEIAEKTWLKDKRSEILKLLREYDNE